MRRRWPLLVLILAPLLALWPGLTGLAIGPFDQIRQMAPWNGPKPAQPWDVLMADSVLQSHVWRTLVLDAWGKGQAPFWNPYEFAGTPLLANSQSGGLYPPHILLGLLHVPAAFAGFLLTWFHLALAGLGTYALTRRLNGSAAAGVTAGLGFALSTFLLGWAPLSSVPATVAWIPLILACVAAFARPETNLLRTAAALAASVAMMFLAGHLQFAAYGLMAAVVFAATIPLLRRSETTTKPSIAILAVVASLIVGGLLAAPQVLPVLTYSKESHRRVAASETGYNDYAGSALRPYELANLGFPLALGNPREPIDVGGHTISTYWPPLVKPGANFAESACSLGFLLFALLFAAPWKCREVWPLAIVGGLSLLVALGTPIAKLMYFLIPGWSSTGSPARVEVLFVLTACTLGGLAVDRITERKAQLASGAGLIVALLLAFVLPNLAPAEGAAAALRGAATTGSLPILLPSLLIAGAALFLAKKSLWTIPAGAALVACVTHALTLVPFGQPLAQVDGPKTDRVAIVNEPWDILTAQPALLPPNLAALNGIHELAGYDSLTSRDAVEMLRTLNAGNDPAPPANGNMMFVKPSLDPAALANLGVTEVWSTKPLPQFGNPENGPGYNVYRLKNPGRVVGGKVAEGYDRIHLITDPGGSITVRDRFVEGWTIANAPASLVLSPARPIGWSLSVPQSKPTGFEATLVYVPPGFRTGTILFVMGTIVLAGALRFANKT